MLPTTSPVPKHIGIIMDGNRRFAKRLMIKPWKGHEWGAEKVRKVLDWAQELGINEITLYAFSIENFDRPKSEFDFLMELFLAETKRLLEKKSIEDLKKKGIRINFIGRIGMFNDHISNAMRKLMEETKGNKTRIVNFAMAYGGRAEIIDAARKIAQQVKEGKLTPEKISEEVFSSELYTESEPDLIVRTSGEHRTSGFMLWQASYAEWFFSEKLWPEFEKEDLIKAIHSYQNRDRRFGK